MSRQLSIEPRPAELAADLAIDLGFNKDIKKAYAGNKAAGRRVRKTLRKIELAAKNGRKEILTIMQHGKDQ